MFNNSSNSSGLHKPVAFHHPSHIPASQPNRRPGQDAYDSGDDLDNCIAEEAIISQKLPSSLIPANIGLLIDQEQQESMGLANSVHHSAELKSRSFSYDGRSQKRYSHHDMLKEAINDYKAATKQKEHPLSSRSKLSSITTSPRQRCYPNPFESSRAASKRQYYEESEGGSYSCRGKENVSAYTELANRMYIEKVLNESQTRRKSFGGSSSKENLLLSKNAIDSIEARRHLPTKEWQEEAMNRLIKQGTEIDETGNALISSYLTREMEECTFAPKTTTNTRPRNLEKFLDDQKQHQEKVEMKRQRLREQSAHERSREREEATFTPAICRKSVKMLEKKSQDGTPAYERLYNKSRPEEDRQSLHSSSQTNLFGKNLPVEQILMARTRTSFNERKSISSSTQLKTAATSHRFTPEIQPRSKNLQRDAKIEDILYSDAFRRLDKKSYVSKHIQKEKKTPPTPLSQASKKALTTRFIREYDMIITEILEGDQEAKLNSTQVLEFLKRLSFIKEYENTNHPYFIQERVLLYDMWQTLNADRHQGIHRRNLLVFLLSVLNMNFTITKILKNQSNNSTVCEFESARPTTSPALPGGVSPRERRIVGSFDIDGNYSVTEKDVQEIHKVYNAWFVNRLHSVDNIGKITAKRNIKDYSYQPEINKTSSNIAHNYREKLLAGTADLIQQNKVPMPKDGKMTHIDLLIASKKVNEEKISRYSDAFYKEQQKDFTFKPQTKRYSSNFNTEGNQDSRMSANKRPMTPESLGKNRVFELYSRAQPTILKRDRHGYEVEFERQQEECTFHPNIQRLEQNQENENPLFAKGIEKSVTRIKNARNAKEKIQRNSERGSKLEDNQGYFVFALDQKVRNGSKDKKPTERRSKSPLPRSTVDSARQTTRTTSNISNNNRKNSLPRGVRLSTSKAEQSHLKEIQNLVDSHIPSYRESSNRNHYEEDKRFSFDGIDNAKKDDNPFNPQQKHSPQSDEKIPLLFVDVNLGLGQTERITVFEGDTSEALSQKFAIEYNLNPHMQSKLKELLDFQIDGLLSRIDEEANSGFTETEKHHLSHNAYAEDHLRESSPIMRY